MALCCLLAFWTGGDHARVDRLFCQSGLLREKWDDVHYGDGSTYGEKTIERAIANTSEFYDSDTREVSSEASHRKGGSSTAGDRDNPAQNHAYLVEKNRLLSDRVDDLEAALETDDIDLIDLQTVSPDLTERIFTQGVLLAGEPEDVVTIRSQLRPTESSNQSPRERFDVALAKIDEHLGSSAGAATDGET